MSKVLKPSQIVYNGLIDEIAKGTLKPGQRLPAIPISKQYMVSRTPVLEALRQMEAEGLVISYPGIGATLVNPTLAEIKETFDVRIILEQSALELACSYPRDILIARLKEVIRNENELEADGDRLEYIKASLNFHRIIADSSKNSLLYKFIDIILSKIFVYQMFLYDKAGTYDLDTNNNEHQLLIDLIVNNQVEDCKKLINDHISRSYQLIKW